MFVNYEVILRTKFVEGVCNINHAQNDVHINDSDKPPDRQIALTKSLFASMDEPNMMVKNTGDDGGGHGRNRRANLSINSARRLRAHIWKQM